MSRSFEWLVAWRYLRDRERANWAVLIVGLLLLAAAGGARLAMAWMPTARGAPHLLLGGLHVSQLMFYLAAALAVLGIIFTVFGACLAAFNLFTTISIFGVFLGVTALIVVLSVMSGFEQDLRTKILGNNAHVRIKSPKNKLISVARLRALLSGKKMASSRSRARPRGGARTDAGPPPRVSARAQAARFAARPRPSPTRPAAGPTKNKQTRARPRPSPTRPAAGPTKNKQTSGKNQAGTEKKTAADELKVDIDGVVAMSPYLQGEVILTGPKTHMGVYLKGVVPHLADRVSDLGKNIVEGVLDNLRHPERLRYLYTIQEPAQTVDFDLDQSAPAGKFGFDLEQTLQWELEGAKPDKAKAKVPADDDVFSPATEPLFEADPALKPPADHNGSHQPKSRKSKPSIAPQKKRGPPQKHNSPPSPGFAPPHAGAPPSGALPLARRTAPLPEPRPPRTGLEGDDEVSVLLGDDFRRPPADQGPQKPEVPTFVPPKKKVLPAIVVGRELAKTLGLHLGDTVDVVSADAGGMGPLGPVPRIKAFRVGGVFFSGHYEFDTKYAYVRLDEAQDFLRQDGQLSGVEIRVEDTRQVGAVSDALRRRLAAADEIDVQTWQQIHRNLFSALKLEKIVMFLVLAIIILVASFSIGCNLIMVVRKKRQEIATLKSMGADNPSIYRIFVIEGLYIGVIGMLLGLGVGLLLCMFLQFFGLRLDPEIYYISKLPVQIDAGEVAAICGACLAISFAATIYPAWQAAQLHPVEAFRNE